MAAGTVVSEFSLVDIVMTGPAVVFRNAKAVFEYLRRIGCFPVTIETINSFVFSLQGKTRRAVLKRNLPGKIAERRFFMTLGTGAAEIAFMRIFMTCFAIVVIDVCEELKRLVVPGADFMTLLTVRLCMLSC